MKVSESWLREWVDPKVSTDDLVHRITMAGLEVDAVEPAAAAFSGVVVGQIESIAPHPDAEKLRVCSVSNGKDSSQVVCGAANAAVGIKIPFAELGATLVICETQLNQTEIESIKPSIDEQRAVSLAASDYCSAYAGRVVRDIDVKAETPLWMREKLRRGGIRSIDPVVDITNYVLLELGQPMHAFDLDKIEGAICVRQASAGEQLTLLDQSSIDMDEDLLVIADGKQALALAGIMGGASSAVSQSTQHVFLESAFFKPERHVGKARRLGMHTDSSHRFERGVDAQGQVRALERATQLLLEICGGKAGPVVYESVDSHLQDGANKITLKQANIKRVLGFEMPAQQVEDIFQRLEFAPVVVEGGWQITAPPHRFDIKIEADLLEELARIYGYDNLPVEPPVAALRFTPQSESQIDTMSFKRTLAARGFREVITYSFIDPCMHQTLFGELEAVKLANPISEEMSVMRVSLVPGLLKAAQQNSKRQQSRFKLFESGLCFTPAASGYQQAPRIAGLMYGTRQAENWLSKIESVTAKGKEADAFDFYDLKAEVQVLLAGVQQQTEGQLEFRSIIDQEGTVLPECQSICTNLLHPGQSAAIFFCNQYLGFCGAIHPGLQKTLDDVTSSWVFELDINLISQKKVPEFKGLSKFPEVRRDIAVIVESSIAAGDLLQAIYDEADQHFTAANIFDRYVGDGIEQGKQSVAIAVTWQHQERTLTDAEVNDKLDTLIARLSKQFNASLR